MNRVGPMENFSFLSDFSKMVLSADMLLGRLEIFPIRIVPAPLDTLTPNPCWKA